MIEQELQERVDALLDDDTQPDWTAVEARENSGSTGRGGAFTRRRLTAVLALAAVIAAVLSLLPGRVGSGQGHVNAVAEALAAVSQGPVLHAVLRVQANQTWIGAANTHPTLDLLDLGSGETTPVSSQMELWYDPDRGLALQVDSVNGTVSWQSLQTPNGYFDDRGQQQTGTGPARIDPALAAFLKGYKQSLSDGSATDEGPGTIDGRAVEWLRFAPLPGNDVPQEVAVDRRTFQAVAMRALCGKCTVTPPTYTIAALEGVARDAVDFSPPKAVDPHPVQLYGGSYEPGTPAEAASYLGRPAYWAGASADGLAFAGMQLARPTNYSTELPSPASVIGTGKGVTFYYGALKPPAFDASPGESYLSIAETADVGFAFHGFNMEELSDDGRPLTVARTTVPPEGQAILTNVGVWVAQLRKDGLYLEIEGTSRAAVVDTARALTAAP